MAWALKIGVVGESQAGFSAIQQCLGPKQVFQATGELSSCSPIICHAQHSDGRIASFHLWDMCQDVFLQEAPALRKMLLYDTAIFLVFVSALEDPLAARAVWELQRSSSAPVTIVVLHGSEQSAERDQSQGVT